MTRVQCQFCYHAFMSNWTGLLLKLVAKNLSLKKTYKNNAGKFTIADLKIHYKTIVTKPMWYCYKNRHVNKWNKTEGPSMNKSNYNHLINNNDSKT